MSKALATIESIEACVIEVDKQRVLVDADVARLYGVETKYINRAVKNNPDKFPKGYTITIDSAGRDEVVQKLHHLENLRFSYATTTAFTEKGLYMLATILKSERATQTTLMIIDTFTKLREFGRLVDAAADEKNEKAKAAKTEQGGNLLMEIIEDSLPITATETTIELNLALVKVKKVVHHSK